MTALVDVEGIGETYAQKLKKAGITTAEDLLGEGSTPQGRKTIAEKTGIGDALILRWVNHVDLFRIKGVAGEYADLLEGAGVDTVPELAQRNAASLVEKLATANEVHKKVRRLPTEEQVAEWIAEAKTLKRVITY